MISSDMCGIILGIATAIIIIPLLFGSNDID